ncbi:MAG: ice-binding family protein [Candidatus Parcubacteria bacterium]|nr:ice-binding family protein [Candidatus Parcubacteria bacterium]
MKLLCKNPIVALLVIFVLLLGIGVIGPMTAQAVGTLPPLGAVATYSVLAQTAITDAGGSSITGDVGMNASGASITGLTGAQVIPGNIYSNPLVAPATILLPAAVQLNAATASGNLVGQGCDFSYGAQDLTLLSPLTPGVYCSSSTFSLSGNLTLSGAGVYIFKSVTSLTNAGYITLAGGARACDVFWSVGSLATINSGGAGTSFAGTIFAGTGVHFGPGVTLDGRALAIGGDVTMGSTTISGPSCAPATGNINVAKIVVGGTKVIADFPLFVNGGAVVSGVTNPFAPGAYTITETGNANYAAAYSVDCVGGTVNLLAGDNKFCVVTNTYTAPPVSGGGGSGVISPLIDVVKVPSPLALPAGPGAVTYTYTVKNPGTVPLDTVTMVGDTCSPITLISGDVNSDSRLQSDETWVYTCATTLTATHTNNVVATGYANGITATDIASATVVVGIPSVPPLIHVTKVPSPLSLPVAGGMITYTEKITNPGTVALSNVQLTDDKCSPLTFISGDTNSDSKLDVTETWTYTCSKNLTQTTTNTATASGFANGLTVRDLAIATVVVPVAAVPVIPVPELPNTGSAPQSLGLMILAFIIMVVSIFLLVTLKKRTN